MEDRLGTLLHLELGDATPEKGAARAHHLVGRKGVDRVTWWANDAFERTDLPVRIRDGRSLLVVEADESYEVPPPTPEVVTEPLLPPAPPPQPGHPHGRTDARPDDRVDQPADPGPGGRPA